MILRLPKFSSIWFLVTTCYAVDSLIICRFPRNPGKVFAFASERTLAACFASRPACSVLAADHPARIKLPVTSAGIGDV